MNNSIESEKISKDLKEAKDRLKAANPAVIIKNTQSAKQKRRYK